MLVLLQRKLRFLKTHLKEKKMTKSAIIALYGVLLIFSCTGNQNKADQKIEPVVKWKLVKEIPLGSIAPIGIAAHGNYLWLSDVDNNRVIKIDLDGKIIESFEDFQRPMHIAIQDNKLYISEYTSDSLKFLEDGKVSTYTLKEKPDAIAGV